MPGWVTFTVKLLSLAAGAAVGTLSLMSLVGAVTDNGWARVIGALVVLLLPPMLITDRLLPDDPDVKVPGLVTDVFSLSWLTPSVIYVVALASVSSPLLVKEGDRLHLAGFPLAAKTAYFLGGVTETAPLLPTPASPRASASSSASASPVASAPASASASASSSSTPAPPAPSAAPTDKRGDRSPAELFRDLSPSVVTIFVKAGQVEVGSGTGFFIDGEGTIATNHHVIARGSHIGVKLKSGSVVETGEVLIESQAADLALLRIDPNKPKEGTPKPDIKPLTLGDSDKVVVGERAISIGNPLGLEHTLTDGLVSARRVYDGRNWIQMSVPVSPGNSGGPIFNMKGEVIGITTRQVLGGVGDRAQNLNLAVPINELKKLATGTYPQRRKFGEAPRGNGQW